MSAPAPVVPSHLRLDVVRQLRDALTARAKPDAPPALLFRLAELDRAAGDLAAAREHYEAYLRHCPAHPQARALLQILSGRAEPWTAVAGQSRPSPFFLADDVLADSEARALWSLLAARQGEFRQARIHLDDAPGLVDTDIRRSLRMPAGGDVAALLMPKVWALIDAHDLVRRFSLPAIRRDGVELDIASSGAGGHFQPHRDNVGAGRRRALTFIYYLYREPRCFEGGDLLLRDDEEAGEPRLAYTRYIPRNNSMLLFPADRLHQVLPVTCPSDDPLDARLTVHGWIQADAGDVR